MFPTSAVDVSFAVPQAGSTRRGFKGDRGRVSSSLYTLRRGGKLGKSCLSFSHTPKLLAEWGIHAQDQQMMRRAAARQAEARFDNAKPQQTLEEVGCRQTFHKKFKNGGRLMLSVKTSVSVEHRNWRVISFPSGLNFSRWKSCKKEK